MSISRIATRYAKSLLDLAAENNTLDNTLEDINLLKQSIDNSRDLYLLLKSPIIKSDKKEKSIDAIFGNALNKITNAFVKIIIRKGREDILPEIVDEFLLQYKILKHITTVTLITAAPIKEDVLADIKQKLKESKVTDNFVEINTEIDPAIIGGFIIKIGDKLYDASVLHNLDLLRKDFVDSKYVISN